MTLKSRKVIIVALAVAAGVALTCAFYLAFRQPGDDLAVLRSYNAGKRGLASPAVMDAALRVFSQTDFRGLSKEKVRQMLGKPMGTETIKDHEVWFYGYHNGEVGVHRRFHFKPGGNTVDRVEILMTM
jgi:hypothetical protein